MTTAEVVGMGTSTVGMIASVVSIFYLIYLIKK